MQSVVAPRTTVSVERTVLRLLGVDGIRKNDGVPLPNVVVDHVAKHAGLEGGIFRSVAAAMIATDSTAQQVAEAIADGELTLTHPVDESAVRTLGSQLGQKAAQQIAQRRAERDHLLEQHGTGPDPLHYVIVASLYRGELDDV